jgi:hypothetical protein
VFSQYGAVGACESADSPYRSWFTFRKPDANEPSPCAPSKDGGDDTYYVGWFGFDTIPELVESADTNAVFVGDGGAVAKWLDAGASGWRLDVMDNLSQGLVKAIRAATKAADPQALLGEQWGTRAPGLGNADSVMNYASGGRSSDRERRHRRPDGQSPARAVAVRVPDAQRHGAVPARGVVSTTPDPLDHGRDNAAATGNRGQGKLRQVAALQLTGLAWRRSTTGRGGPHRPDDRRPPDLPGTHGRDLCDARDPRARKDRRLADDAAGISPSGAGQRRGRDHRSPLRRGRR